MIAGSCSTIMMHRARTCYHALRAPICLAGRRRALSAKADRPDSKAFGFEVLAMMGVATAGLFTLGSAAYENPMATCLASQAAYRPHCQQLQLGADIAR